MAEMGSRGCLLRSVAPGRSVLLPKLRIAMDIPKRADTWMCPPLGIYLTIVWVRVRKVFSSEGFVTPGAEVYCPCSCCFYFFFLSHLFRSFTLLYFPDLLMSPSHF